MGWFDSGFGDWFGGSLSDYGSSSDGFDWGSVLGSAGDGFGSGGDSGFDWNNVDLGSVFGGGGSGGSGSTGGFNWGSLFGGGSSGSSGSGNIFGALLGGLQGAAAAKLDEKAVKQAGIERRKSSAFEADLVDYYKQKDKSRKRVALDTYGQFSQLKRWAPNYTNTPAVEQPAKPNPNSY